MSGSSRFNVNAPDIGMVRLAVITIGEDLLRGSAGSSLDPLSTLLLLPSSFRRLPGLFGRLGLGPISPPTPAVWWRHCSLVHTFNDRNWPSFIEDHWLSRGSISFRPNARSSIELISQNQLYFYTISLLKISNFTRLNWESRSGVEEQDSFNRRDNKLND